MGEVRGGGWITSATVLVINIITVAIRKCRTRSCKSNEKLAARSTLPLPLPE